MQRQRVSSTNIISIGYDIHKRLLEIEFLDSGIYQYLNVPESIFRGIMSASSQGIYFSQHIKETFHFKKLDKDAFNAINKSK